MKEKKQIRTFWFTIRMNEEEEEKLNHYYKKTTANSLSEYARSVFLKEPVTVLYRNQSADDFLAEGLQLKNELNAIGNNFNQAVQKLYTIDKVPEIKAWIILNESIKKAFMEKVEKICERMNQIYYLWLQK